MNRLRLHNKAVIHNHETVPVSEARKMISELVDRVAFEKLRLVVSRNDKPCVAMVPICDLERLVNLDRFDAQGMLAEADRSRDVFDKGLDLNESARTAFAHSRLRPNEVMNEEQTENFETHESGIARCIVEDVVGQAFGRQAVLGLQEALVVSLKKRMEGNRAAAAMSDVELEIAVADALKCEVDLCP